MRELKKKNAQTGIITLIGLVAVSCGGGGGSTSPSMSTSPPPPHPPPVQSNNTFPATGGVCDGTAGWQAIADDNLDDSAAIQTSLRSVERRYTHNPVGNL